MAQRPRIVISEAPGKELAPAGVSGISLIVPVFNEQASIPLFLDAVVSRLERISRQTLDGQAYEIVFINDGSRDGTEFVVRAAIQHNPRVRLVNLSRNFGKEAALAAGLAHASGRAVIPIDVDLQDPPELLETMVVKWKEGAKVVNAKRANRNSDSWLKRQTSGWFYRIYNRLAEYPISANVGDFRLLDREVVEILKSMNEHNRFSKGLFSWVGFKSATIDYERPERAAGTSKWPYGRLWSLAVDGIVASTTIPLRVATWVGLMLGLLSAIYGSYIIIRTLLYGVDVPGYASLMAVVLFFGSINLISIGILGEYVGRIAREVRGRPNYIVESKVGFNS